MLKECTTSCNVFRVTFAVFFLIKKKKKKEKKKEGRSATERSEEIYYNTSMKNFAKHYTLYV